MADKIQKSSVISGGFSIISFGFVCMYVLDTPDGAIAFDSGMQPAAVLREFKKLGLDAARVRHVFLTHSDRDHTGGLGAFPQASVTIPKDEVAMTERTTARFFGLMYNRPLGRPYATVTDAQELALSGARIRCIATPGHTAGSMSFLLNDEILIVGDILNIKRGRAVMDRGIINMDREKRLASIRKLSRFQNVSLLCTMHSGYTEDFDRAMKEWRS